MLAFQDNALPRIGEKQGVNRHNEFTELPPTLLNQFAEKFVVHKAVKTEGKRPMQADICLNFTGSFDLPETEEEQKEIPAKNMSASLHYQYKFVRKSTNLAL